VVTDPVGFGTACAELTAALSDSLALTYFRPTRPDRRRVAAPPIWARAPQQQQ
jgi:hypothetical protein